MSTLQDYLSKAAQAERVLKNYNTLADAANSAKDLYESLHEECEVIVKELSDDELKFMNSEWAKGVVKNHSLSTLVSMCEELKDSNGCVDIHVLKPSSSDLYCVYTTTGLLIDSSESLQKMVDLCEQMGWNYDIENP